MNRRSFWKTLVVAPIAAAAGFVAGKTLYSFTVDYPVDPATVIKPAFTNYGGIDRSAANNEWWNRSKEGTNGTITEKQFLQFIRTMPRAKGGKLTL